MQIPLPNNLRSLGLTFLIVFVLGAVFGFFIPQFMERKPSARLASVDGDFVPFFVQTNSGRTSLGKVPKKTSFPQAARRCSTFSHRGWIPSEP